MMAARVHFIRRMIWKRTKSEQFSHLAHRLSHFNCRSAQELLEGNEEYFNKQPCVSLSSFITRDSSHVQRHRYYPWLKAWCERGRKIHKKHPLWYDFSLTHSNDAILFHIRIQVAVRTQQFELSSAPCAAQRLVDVFAVVAYGSCGPAEFRDAARIKLQAQRLCSRTLIRRQ